MKHPITLRLDPVLLAHARNAAVAENRTLTNFIETLIKRHVGPPRSNPPVTSTDRNAREDLLRG